MSNLEIYCVTDKEVPFLEDTNYKLVAVGKGKFPEKYLKCDYNDNIFYKEKNYSELTFHYWFWKNQLPLFSDDVWIGFCQKRRFWLKNEKIPIQNFYNKDSFLTEVPSKWQGYNAIICEPINLEVSSFTKLIKKGWKNIIKNPSIIFDKKKHSIK